MPSITSSVLRSSAGCLPGILATTLLGLAGTAQADFDDAVVVRYAVTATEVDGTPVSVMVEDLYLLTDDPKDVDLNIYDLDLPAAAQVPYFQSSTAPGWLPANLGQPFDSSAVQFADSFVTVGGFAGGFDAPAQLPGSGGASALDPFFGGETVDHPNRRAGWFNSSPPNLQGLATQTPAGLGVLIGRFAHDGEFSLVDATFSATWNQGIGTPGKKAGFTVREFIDCNGNLIEDAVEIANGSVAPSIGAVRWPASKGGNDHWYELVLTPTTVADARAAAAARGGYLATFSVAGESDFVAGAFAGETPSASVGGGQRQPAVEPLGSWGWNTGEAWNGVDWRSGEPNDSSYFGGIEGSLEIYLSKSLLGDFNDVSGVTPRAYLIEWDAAADCNGNGVLDTCDIASGFETDFNGNRVPDSCEAIMVPSQVATIQSAIDAAPDGGLVLVSAGTYVENLVFPADGRDVVLLGTDGEASTTIDGTTENRATIEMAGGQSFQTRIAGFAIVGGRTGSFTPVDNPQFLAGGGMLVQDSSPFIHDCTFQGNRSTFGGNFYGLFFDGEIRDCLFDDGFAQSDGGNLQFNKSSVVVATSTFTGGTAVNDGGGVKVVNGFVDMIDCEIVDGQANTGGGVMYFETTGEETVFNFLRCSVSGNTAKFGGGFWSRPTESGPTLAETTVCENLPDNFFGPLIDLGGNTLCLCVGDLDFDGEISGADLGLWLLASGTTCPENGFCPGDLDGDGEVRGGDLGLLLVNWGPCQP